MTTVFVVDPDRPFDNDELAIAENIMHECLNYRSAHHCVPDDLGSRKMEGIHKLAVKSQQHAERLRARFEHQINCSCTIHQESFDHEVRWMDDRDPD